MFGYNSNLEKISLKYGDKVPEGYNVSEIQFTFDFIYLVFKRDASIDGAVRGVANEYDLSEDFLMDYLIENKYILNKHRSSVGYAGGGKHGSLRVGRKARIRHGSYKFH